MTVHAVYNPHQSDAQPNAPMDRSPGFGIIEFDRATREIAISLWPRRIDPRAPGAHPADGWPVRIAQLDNGWSLLRLAIAACQEAGGLRNFLRRSARDGADTIYTIRIQGRFVRAAGAARGHLLGAESLDPDGSIPAAACGIKGGEGLNDERLVIFPGLHWSSCGIRV